MRLVITPASEARRVVREAGPSHLLRFVSPDRTDEAADLRARETLILAAHDIAEPAPGLIAPARPMIRALLAFGRSWDGARPLVAQCWAGVSRSTAAAFIIACDKRPEVAEHALAARLRRIAPQATPNPLMVAHADALLGRAGRMSAALEAIGRGAEFTGFAAAELDLEGPAPSRRLVR